MALTTAANYKTWAKISVATYDTELALLVTQAEKLVAEVLDRRLEDSGAAAIEYYDGRGDDMLYLKAWPVTSITSVSYLSSVSSGVAAYTAYDGSEYYATDDGRLIRANVLDYAFPDSNAEAYSTNWPCGRDNIKVIYRGGYTSSTVPADLALCIYEVVATLQHGRDGTRDVPQQDELRAFILDRVGHYRRAQA